MQNKINSIIAALGNFLEGLWNNAGILGRITAIVLAIPVILFICFLWTFKILFNLLGFLVDEVNFYLHLWKEATEVTINILDEIIQKKVLIIIKDLWKRLFDNSHKFRLNNVENTLSVNWSSQLLKSLFKQIYLVFAGLLVFITCSSFCYYFYCLIYSHEINKVYIFLFRLLLLTPLLHRFFRYSIKGEKFSWTSDTINESQNRVVKSNLPFVGLLVLVLILSFVTFFSPATHEEYWNSNLKPLLNSVMKFKRSFFNERPSINLSRDSSNVVVLKSINIYHFEKANDSTYSKNPLYDFDVIDRFVAVLETQAEDSIKKSFSVKCKVEIQSHDSQILYSRNCLFVLENGEVGAEFDLDFPKSILKYRNETYHFVIKFADNNELICDKPFDVK